MEAFLFGENGSLPDLAEFLLLLDAGVNSLDKGWQVVRLPNLVDEIEVNVWCVQAAMNGQQQRDGILQALWPATVEMCCPLAAKLGSHAAGSVLEIIEQFLLSFGPGLLLAGDGSDDVEVFNVLVDSEVCSIR